MADKRAGHPTDSHAYNRLAKNTLAATRANLKIVTLSETNMGRRECAPCDGICVTF